MANGHEVLVTASEKDVTARLLRAYGIPYVSLGSSGGGVAANCGRTALSTLKLLKTAFEFSPDLLVAVSPVRAAPVARLLGRHCLGLDDTEHARLAHRVYGPFVTLLLTPECYGLDVGPKQRRYRGYHELAYLHPRYFTPDSAVLEREGLSAELPYSFVRFVAWSAAHDVGHCGFSAQGRIRLVRELAQYGRVLVSCEGKASPELACHAFHAPPHLIHHFLYHARVCVTEGGTTASECAVLGTPAVCMNTLYAGVQDQLQHQYRLVFGFHSREYEHEAIRTAVRIANGQVAGRREWRARSYRLVSEHIDVTRYLVETIESILHGAIAL
jgi:predicted glycosyltransferase